MSVCAVFTENESLDVLAFPVPFSVTVSVYTAVPEQVVSLGANSANVTLPVGVPPAVAEIVAASCGNSSWAVTMVAGAF